MAFERFGSIVTVVCLGLVTTMAACAEPEPDDTGESTAALLANPTIARGSTWRYWDRGGDPGPNWGAIYYDDNSWSSGAGPLGYGESYLATAVSYGPDPANKPITTYFRYDFHVDDPDRVEHLLAEVMYDDGFAVRLNDNQFAWAGFPGQQNTFTSDSLAVGHEAENKYQSFDWSLARSYLIRGTNTISVEVHQNDRASSDLVFDLSLAVVVPELTPGVAIPRRSTAWMYDDYYHNNNSTAWARVDASEFYFRQGTAPLGYGESYIATQVRPPDDSWELPTTYYRHRFHLDDPAAITELSGELMYDDGVAVYLNGTRIDSRAMPPGEPVQSTLALGHEANNRYEARDWSQHRGLLLEGNNVIAVELHQQTRTSSDAVLDLALTYRTAPPPPVPTEDIARGAVWTYWDRGGDQGTAWRGPAFDDSTWRRGAAPLGYGEPYLATTIEYGPSATNKYRTTYVRNRFRIADRNTVTGLVADVMYDDGVVIYLNGTEVNRRFMPSGTVTAMTFATNHETGNAYERVDLGAAKHLLVDGDNVITVEIHQSSASSSDLTFDLALDVTSGGPPPPPPAPGIARGSSWRYFTAPHNPPYNWTDDRDDFDESTWPLLPGPLGYGETYVRSTIPYGSDPANKYMAAYFRSSFVIQDPALVTSLIAELMYDDGAVLYLNGSQIERRSMPGGAIDHSTRALGHEANNTYESIDLTRWKQYLKPGRNEIAVSVHQESPSSSDLVFDLALRVQSSPPPRTVARKSNWLYYDRGPLPAGWQTSGDDSAWDVGRAPLGYNHGYESTGIGYVSAGENRRPNTTYFRRHFTMPAPFDVNEVTELTGLLMVDDGAVVYLNGHEIARTSMPSGAVTFDTHASTHDTNTYEVFDWSAGRNVLREGDNVLAVEVHQDSPASSERDLIFDLGFEVIGGATPTVAGCKPVTPTATDSLNGVWIAPDGAVWAVGSAGLIGRRHPGGRWAWCFVDIDAQYQAVWGTGDNDVLLVGNEGLLLRWNGTAFNTVDFGITSPLYDVWGSGPNDIFVVGGSGVVRHFDGTQWQVADMTGVGHLEGVWGASAADVWAVGTQYTYDPDDDYGDVCYARVFRWDPVAHSFALEAEFHIGHGGCSMQGIGGSSATDVWAVGDMYPAGAAAGFAAAWHYDGARWAEVTPSDEEYNAEREYSDVASHAPGAETGAWITAAGASAVRYDGATWSTAPTPLTNNLLSVDVRGTKMFAVGGSNKVLSWFGGAWRQER